MTFRGPETSYPIGGWASDHGAYIAGTVVGVTTIGKKGIPRVGRTPPPDRGAPVRALRTQGRSGALNRPCGALIRPFCAVIRPFVPYIRALGAVSRPRGGATQPRRAPSDAPDERFFGGVLRTPVLRRSADFSPPFCLEGFVRASGPSAGPAPQIRLGSTSNSGPPSSCPSCDCEPCSARLSRQAAASMRASESASSSLSEGTTTPTSSTNTRAPARREETRIEKVSPENSAVSGGASPGSRPGSSRSGPAPRVVLVIGPGSWWGA